MSFELSFYSSEIERVTHIDGQLRVRFSAAHLYRNNADGSSTPGYAGPLELCFEAALVTGDLHNCVGGLAEGWFMLDGVRVGKLTLPLEAGGGVQMECRLINGSTLAVSASAARCGTPDPEAFTESYAC
jgi:hypothetical protein